MPAKIARLATRPLFWIPEVSVAVRSSRPSCSKAEKREYSWQIGSHPGNPGLNGIFYVMRAGCPWRLLPNDLPPWETIYRWFAAYGTAAKSDDHGQTPAALFRPDCFDPFRICL